MNAAGFDPDAGDLKTQLRQDLGEVRLGQARLLLKRTRMSCLIVEGVILYFTALIAFSGHPTFAFIWFALTSSMVLVVYLYSHLFRQGITLENHRHYLLGHTMISGMTGLVWSALAIAYLDPSSTLNLFISVNIVASIALGGMLPSAEYRPTFISLSTGMFVPFSIYWLITVEGPVRLIGVGLIILYGFGLLVSARSEMQTIETLAAERNKRLYKQLQEQNRKIEIASAEKSRFLAATSHDMSQPLQSQGFFIRALKQTIATKEQADLLAKIEAAWHSQKDMLQALVETARLSSGAIVARTGSFDIADILTELESDFAEAARLKSLSFTVSHDPMPVECDRLLVGRILRNLIGNAIKFTNPGDSVTVSWREQESGILVEVADTGPGIDPADQDRIFEEYVQLDTDEGQRGLGLGLPIVRQLAATLGIPLHFKSQPGWGTRVGIELPVSGREPEPAPVIKSDLPVGGSPLVLVVEDEAGVREGLAMLLTQWGCRVVAAESGKEARRILSWANEPPVFIIADKRLSDGEDGIDAIAALREEVLDTVPAVLLTGEVYDFANATQLEDLTVIAKPADSETLRAALDRALEKHPSAR
jgi:signal transduction histidine kinase/ActR/RegA family two-component response regulator